MASSASNLPRRHRSIDWSIGQRQEIMARPDPGTPPTADLEATSASDAASAPASTPSARTGAQHKKPVTLRWTGRDVRCDRLVDTRVQTSSPSDIVRKTDQTTKIPTEAALARRQHAVQGGKRQAV